jgi:hypothetical protein
MGLSACTAEQPEPEKTVLNQYLETTNLGAGSSNLSGRASILLVSHMN